MNADNQRRRTPIGATPLEPARLRSALKTLEAYAPGIVDIPDDDWKTYCNAALCSECEGVVPPRRALRSTTRFCSERCYTKHHKRNEAKKRRAKKSDAIAISDAFGRAV